MNPYLNSRHCLNLADAVTSVGGTVPEDLAGILASLTAVRNWRPDTSADVATLVAAGKFTADRAAKMLDAASTAPTTDPARTRDIAERELVRAFDKALIAGAGDEIIASVRPVFEEAARGVIEAATWIKPTTDAAAAIDLGDEAVAAWRALPKLRRTLDAIDHTIIGALVEPTSFNCIGALPWMHPSSSGYMRALFYIRDADVDLHRAARFMSAPVAPDKRGGRWLELLTTSTIKLNGLTRARALRDHYAAEIRQREAQQHAETHPEYESIRS